VQVGWLGTAVLMIKTQIGLGVLSIPSVLNTLGMGPGLVVLIVIGGITTWSNYVIGTFKKNHPSVYGIDDVGYKLFGKAGKEFFAVVFVLCECCCCPDGYDLGTDNFQFGSSLPELAC
jgi:amino acid permease